MIRREVDPDDGIIFVTSDGAATRADIDEHYDALRLLIAEMREAGRPVRVLSDVTSSPRQAADVETHILAQMGRTFRSGDRVALLAGQGDNAYVRTLLANVDVATFSSRLPAEMWLLLDELPHQGTH